ncbi:hypothetical protein DCAR_0832802 [Daucus carota subsp. sativus]|uniref:Cysteine protease n=1 Tax=Daucus carota subsp. sativus TaxID=79200 RepID=A0AAF0XS56_DAUCS|nr:PREDICTED: cysteine protease ATG4-like isoform X1 [Daucus carota subsp. sativus]XP_017222547.1 PREDICTED: cysteine protease ATG4-like isoform X1 [Daucus carota subsp. sativus]WOH13293.1 hypothetical protein DCAR_0832802 [Daucus carota subsp. sativus]
MRRFQERVLGINRTGISISVSDIWLLGVCYSLSNEDSSSDPIQSHSFAAFVEDFESRILMTYRKGFAAIGETKYTSDVNWGCMLRSSQMLVAQALIIHRLGRNWRKSLEKPLNKDYIEILHYFGDSEASAFSVHNLLQAGKHLSPGSWVGPYAMCRTWEALAQSKLGETELGNQSLPMAMYVVCGDENGERGGAPVLCIEDASRLCREYSRGQADWTPILLLVPLVLGLDKLNPRYIPLLVATFTFPQSLGILGGKPGVSTYIVAVQDDNAFYLDPHEVKQVVDITQDNLEADTSSYHCNIIRQISLELIDPSLAIGFYCRDKDDFDNFCSRASDLAAQSKGAPLLTVMQSRNSTQTADDYEASCDTVGVHDHDPFDAVPTADADNISTQEDEWQLL